MEYGKPLIIRICRWYFLQFYFTGNFSLLCSIPRIFFSVVRFFKSIQSFHDFSQGVIDFGSSFLTNDYFRSLHHNNGSITVCRFSPSVNFHIVLAPVEFSVSNTIIIEKYYGSERIYA